MSLVLDKYGRPISGLDQAEPPPGDWGVLKVYCGTTDVTTWRGVPAIIERYGYTEPFWYGPAAISFPQIGPYDYIGGTDIPWWEQGMNVTIKRLHPDNVTETQVWEGFAGSWNPVMDDDGYRVRFECTGALHQTMLEPYPPRFSKDAIDIGQAIADAMNTQVADKFGPLPVVNTGILTRNRGSWQTRFDYISELLATAYTADRDPGQWTLKCLPGRFPRLALKNTTTRHWTVTNGYYGVKLNVTSDIMSSSTTIYGEGQEADGCRWRNSRYDAPGTLPTFRPLAWVLQNEQFIYDERGRNVGMNPAFDPYSMRVARYINYGPGVTQEEATRSAEAELRRDVNPGWFGNLELKIDPEEGSRMDIRAGDNIGVRYHHSPTITLFHVSAVDHVFSNEGIITTLTVDTNMRDDTVILSLQQRNREAARDPRRNLSPPRQKSKNTPDERTVFDCENKAGFMPSISHAGGSWHVVPIPCGDYGQIVRTEFTTVASKVKFAMGIFSKRPTISLLNSLVGNPLSQEAPWDDEADALSDAGLLIAWGSSEEAMGYYPGTQQKEKPITGRFLDGQTWDYFSDDVPWLYAAFYLAGSANISGRLTPGVED